MTDYYEPPRNVFQSLSAWLWNDGAGGVLLKSVALTVGLWVLVRLRGRRTVRPVHTEMDRD